MDPPSSIVAPHWSVATRTISPRLRGLARAMNGYVEWTAAPRRRRELPGPRVVVILELGPPLRVFDNGSVAGERQHAGGFVAGLDDRFTITAHDGFQAGIELDLTPRGAQVLLGLPLSEIAGRAVSLDDVLPRPNRGLSSHLADLATWEERFDEVERLLLVRSRDADGPDLRVAWAVRRIEARGGNIAIGAITRELGESPKRLIALFHEHVGVAPKVFARLVRFDRLVGRIEDVAGAGSGNTAPEWAALAQEVGYADQSHLIRDVRAMTGATPSEVLALLAGRTTLA
jgi:AraC-like DNA-binding protein